MVTGIGAGGIAHRHCESDIAPIEHVGIASTVQIEVL